MPAEVTDIDILKEYISGVMNRADHHAKNVNEVSLALVGAILWKKDDEPITVRTQRGEMKNVLWVNISGVKYAFSYNHRSGYIDMRQDSLNGMLIYSFSNQTPLSKIREIFETL